MCTKTMERMYESVSVGCVPSMRIGSGVPWIAWGGGCERYGSVWMASRQ
jgi:hypothetical protein